VVGKWGKRRDDHVNRVIYYRGTIVRKTILNQEPKKL
jgi:hypothetical protein